MAEIKLPKQDDYEHHTLQAEIGPWQITATQKFKPVGNPNPEKTATKSIKYVISDSMHIYHAGTLINRELDRMINPRDVKHILAEWIKEHEK